MGGRNQLMFRSIVVLFGAAMLEIAAFGGASKPVEPTRPSVDVKIIPGRDTVGRGKNTRISVVVANSSNTELKALRVRSLNPDFPVDTKLANVVPPFGSEQTAFDVKPSDNAEFGQHRVGFLVDYDWSSAGKQFHSTQTTSVPLTVQRPFEDEAKGLPGGTGALLFLLLPVMPAFLAFEFVNSIRKGEGFRIPTFSTDYVLPAFFLGLGASFLVLLVAKRKIDFAYADPVAFGKMLLVSIAIGAAIPLLLWIIDAIKWLLYGFHETDTGVQYLRKALQLNSKGLFQWTTGTAGGQEWQGMVLRQPNGKLVLGARVQVSARAPLTAMVVGQVFHGDTLINAKQMERWLKDGSVTIGFRARILRGQVGSDSHVITDGLDGFTATAAQTSRLIEVV